MAAGKGSGGSGRSGWGPGSLRVNKAPLTPAEVAELYGINVYPWNDPSRGFTTDLEPGGDQGRRRGGNDTPQAWQWSGPATQQAANERSARVAVATGGGGLSKAMSDALVASQGGSTHPAMDAIGNMQTASATGVNSAGGGSPLAGNKVGGTTSGTDTTAFTFRGSDKAYSPSDIAAMLANPALFQGEYLDSLGINTPTASGSMGEYYRLLPILSQFFLAQQQGPVTDADRQAGLYRDLLEQYTTPGGRSANLSEMMRALFNAGQPGSGQLPTNMLQANYANMAPDDQIRAVNNLFNAAIAGMPGGYGDALSNLFAQAGTLYQQQNLNANQGSSTNNIPDTAYYEWLETNPLFRRIAGL